ncbi:MAG TPA: hypothetical protein VED59_05310 [Acidimicrobiales bacterium]|nr:hypothetical protein [Acidimicrobiales bacterium]
MSRHLWYVPAMAPGRGDGNDVVAFGAKVAIVDAELQAGRVPFRLCGLRCGHGEATVLAARLRTCSSFDSLARPARL